MRPDAKSGALLQVNPLAPRLEGARLTPLITIQAFCTSSVKPPSMSTVMMATALGLAISRTRVLSTGGMLEAARTTKAPVVLVATETGMLHQLRRANPAVRWEAANPDAVCRFMKMTTPAALLRCLRDGTDEVHVDPDVAARARRAVQAMIAVGSPSAAGE